MDTLKLATHSASSSHHDPRVLIISHRRRPDGFSRQPGYVSFIESEDVLMSVSGADVAYLTASPASLAYRLRRLAGRQARRVFGRRHTLPPLPRDSRAVTIDAGACHYDLIVFVAMTIWDLPMLEQLHDLRSRATRIVAWFPEIWPSTLENDHRIALEPFSIVDDIYVGVAATAPLLSAQLGRTVDYLPMAVDAARFAALRPDAPRPVDVLGIGRRLPALHEALLAWSRKSDRNYVYDTISGGQVLDYQAHRENLASMYRHSALAITHYAKFDQPEVIGTVRELSGRVWEGLAGGAIMVGMPPSTALQSQWPGESVVEDLGGDPAAAIERIDHLCRQPLSAARRRNVQLALRGNDWAHRWQRIFAAASLPTPVALEDRLEHLRKLAATLEPDTAAIKTVNTPDEPSRGAASPG